MNSCSSTISKKEFHFPMRCISCLRQKSFYYVSVLLDCILHRSTFVAVLHCLDYNTYESWNHIMSSFSGFFWGEAVLYPLYMHINFIISLLEFWLLFDWIDGQFGKISILIILSLSVSKHEISIQVFKISLSNVVFSVTYLLLSLSLSILWF